MRVIILLMCTAICISSCRLEAVLGDSPEFQVIINVTETEDSLVVQIELDTRSEQQIDAVYIDGMPLGYNGVYYAKAFEPSYTGALTVLAKSEEGETAFAVLERPGVIDLPEMITIDRSQRNDIDWEGPPLQDQENMSAELFDDLGNVAYSNLNFGSFSSNLTFYQNELNKLESTLTGKLIVTRSFNYFGEPYYEVPVPVIYYNYTSERTVVIL